MTERIFRRKKATSQELKHNCELLKKYGMHKH